MKGGGVASEMGRIEEELMVGGGSECEILGDIQEEATAGWASLMSREGIWA